MTKIIDFPKQNRELGERVRFFSKMIKYVRDKKLVYFIPVVNIAYFAFEYYRLGHQGKELNKQLIEFIENLDPEERSFYARGLEELIAMNPVQFDRFLNEYMNSVNLSQKPEEVLQIFLELAKRCRREQYLKIVN